MAIRSETNAPSRAFVVAAFALVFLLVLVTQGHPVLERASRLITRLARCPST